MGSVRPRCGIISGAPLVAEAIIHDYEDTGFGAQGILAVGARGTGKTTLLERCLQRSSYLEDDRISKSDYLDIYWKRQNKEAKMLQQGYDPKDIPDALPKFPCREIPETVLYAGREFDYWHNFLERPIWEEFENPKPVRILLPQGEEFHFVVGFADGLRDLILDGIVCEYSDSRDLIRKLKEGAINVWYPPKDYTFPTEIMENFKQRNLSEKSLMVKHSNWMNFDLLYQLMHYRYKKHISWFVDEVHGLIPSMARDTEWHVIDWFSREIDPELRRCHISSFGSTHKSTNIDSRHMNIQEWYLWTGGSNPDKRYSRVVPAAVQNCKAGRCIIEKKGFKFGLYDYDRLEGQLPKIRTVRGGLDEISLKSPE